MAKPCGKCGGSGVGSGYNAQAIGKANSVQLVRYLGPEESHTLKGAVTGQNYGTVSNGDILNVWTGDYEASTDLFKPIPASEAGK